MDAAGGCGRWQTRPRGARAFTNAGEEVNLVAHDLLTELNIPWEDQEPSDGVQQLELLPLQH